MGARWVCKEVLRVVARSANSVGLMSLDSWSSERMEGTTIPTLGDDSAAIRLYTW